MKRTLALVLSLLAAGCSEPLPDFGPGPFRGPLFDPLPVATETTGAPEVTAEPAAPVEVAPELEAASSRPPDAEQQGELTKATAPIPSDHAPETTAPSAPDLDPEPPTHETASGEAAEAQAALEVDPNEEVLLLNFDELADFDYTPPTLDEIENGSERPEQVPKAVLAFNQKLVEIEGYMIPIEVEQGKVKSFILSRTLSGCCFGDMPNIQEWVDVKMESDKDADYVPYAPVLVIGRISVGELVDEYGITSLYRMTAESVEDPW